ncbi:MAG: hypothetical protein M3025_08485, partial [Actinomycetota bacterium]|nr:hypothetical protein [Actinomycetota bacterium]
AGPLASVFGARTVLGAGSVIGLVVLALALVPKSTRELGDGRPAKQAAGALGDGPSAKQVAREIRIEGRGEAEVADVDPLVRVMD